MASPKVLVECQVCREVYDYKNLCPRMLKCGHSFCTRCLWHLLNANEFGVSLVQVVNCLLCRGLYVS